MDNTISKARPPHKSMDYHFLREEGLRHIQELSGSLWTDYNSHDPGITLLEILCYAITDLGYRTSLPIEDLLAGGQGDGKDFYGVTEILPCNPVTLTDLRKLIIDQPGIRNAWIEKNEDSSVRGRYDIMLELEEHDEWGDLNFNLMKSVVTENSTDYDFEVLFPFWDELLGVDVDQEITAVSIADAENGTQIFIPIQHGENSQENVNDYYAELQLVLNNDTDHPIRLAAWIKVTSEVSEDTLASLSFQDAIRAKLIETGGNEEDELTGRYWQKISAAITNVSEVKAMLHNYRPLCEDFRSFRAFRVQEISIRADVDLSPDARPGEVLGEMYYRIHAFLSPKPHFYTLQELLDKGLPMEDIFEGPLLLHGFLDSEELEAIRQRATIYTSDLLQLLTDVPGLVAVRDLRIANHYNNDILEQDVVDCLRLASPDRYKPQLSPDKSQVNFYKDHLSVTADPLAALERFETLKSQSRQEKKAVAYDLSPPRGEDRAVENYFSIQHHFPPVYGIGEEQLAASATELRKAQALQLKGYLLFFEQLLADYFAQLANLKSLFSMEATIDKTYFFRPLSELVPETDDLLTGNLGLLGESGQPGMFHERRNRFLDHLMARFCENFSDYALFLYASAEDAETAAGDLVADKIAFLQEYTALSQDRTKAFNYKAQKPDENDPGVLVPDLWDTDNVSGLKKRVARLLGLESYHRGATEGFHLIEHLLLSPGSGNDPVALQIPLEEVTDPYSFRISFIMPSEHPKLGDPGFRQYAERVIRSETPAHIVPYIYWVNNVVMNSFETAYRNWLEQAFAPEVRNTLVQALNNIAIGS